MAGAFSAAFVLEESEFQMVAQPGYDPFLKRKIRMEGWEGQGASTIGELRAALRARNAALATDLLDIYAWEAGSLYQGYMAWICDWVAAIGAREGAGLWRYIEAAHEHAARFGLHGLPLNLGETASRVTDAGIALVEDGALAEDGGRPALCRGADRISLEPWLAAGCETQARVRSDIDGGRWDAAAEGLERLHREHKPYHDVYSDVLWLWMTMLADAWGEDAMIALMAESGDRLRADGLKALPSIPLDAHVRHLVSAMRGHRSGPGEEGDISVTEDDEKYIVRFDPCGSGGRMRREGEVDGLPPRQGPPFNFGSTRKAHDMSWGREGVPYYCIHCAAYAEMQSTDLIGYPSRVTLFDPDGDRACAWAFYKKPADIPESYFARIGKRKPVAKA